MITGGIVWEFDRTGGERVTTCSDCWANPNVPSEQARAKIQWRKFMVAAN